MFNEISSHFHIISCLFILFPNSKIVKEDDHDDSKSIDEPDFNKTLSDNETYNIVDSDTPICPRT